MNGLALFGVAVVALASAGCSVATNTFNDGASAGGAIVGSLGAPPVAPLPPAPPAMGAFLEGPAGSRLSLADRDKAYQAEIDALSGSDRKTWRGDKGSYGFVAPASAETPDGCRGFTHTIYIAGRPQSGKGTGCKAPDGTWKIT